MRPSVPIPQTAERIDYPVEVTFLGIARIYWQGQNGALYDNREDAARLSDDHGVVDPDTALGRQLLYVWAARGRTEKP